MSAAAKTRVIKLPKFFDKNKSVSIPAFFIALISAVALANFVWLFVDHRPLAWDESIHYMGAVGYYRVLQQGGWGMLKNLLYLSDFYPPLTEFIGSLFFLVTKPSTDVAAFLDVFFIGGILWMLYLISKRLFGPETGILAGYLFAASSAVVIQSKVFMLDISLAFFVTLGFYAFYASENFLKKRWALVYGLTFGLAMLNKWSALFFLGFPPLILAVLATLRKHDQRGKIWLYVMLSYAVAAAIAGPWYGVHFVKLVKNTSGYIHARGVLENDPSLLSPKAWFYYLGSVFKQTSIPLALLLYGGFAWFCVRRKEAFWMVLWLGIPYLILMLIRNKDHRYIIPMLPLLCLAGSVWIQSLKKPLQNKVLLGLVIFALLQMTYCHIGKDAGWLHFLTKVKVAGVPVVDSWAPDKRQWPLGAILADVRQHGKTLQRKPILRVIPDQASFSRVTFVVEQSRRDAGVQLTSTSNWPMFTDYAVTKTGSLGLDFNVDKPRKITLALQIESHALHPRFELLQKYALPDGSEAMLYGRKDILSESGADEIIQRLRQELDYLVSAYVRDAEECSIMIEPYSAQETRLGHFRKIRVQARNGQVGDFKHNDLGVPFESLDVEVTDLILDNEELDIGKLLLYSVGRLKVNDVVIKAEALNEAISREKGDIQSLRVACRSGILSARWTGLLPVQAAVALKVIPDPHVKGSQNLRFSIRKVKIGWLTIPGLFLQPLLEDFNPLFKLAGFPGLIDLGSIRLQQDEIRLGTELNHTR